MNRFLPRYSPCVSRHSVLQRFPAAGAGSPASLGRSRRLPARGHRRIKPGHRPRLVRRTRAITVSTLPARYRRQHRQQHRAGLRRARTRGIERVAKYAVQRPVGMLRGICTWRAGCAPPRLRGTVRVEAPVPPRPERRQNASARARRSARSTSLTVLSLSMYKVPACGQTPRHRTADVSVRSSLTRTGYSDNTSGVRRRGRPRSAGMRMGRRGTGRPGPALRR